MRAPKGQSDEKNHLLIVVLQENEDILLSEDGAQRLVLPAEAQAHQAVPLLQIDRWQRTPGFDPHDRRVDFWRRPKVVFTNLEGQCLSCQSFIHGFWIWTLRRVHGQF